MNPLSGRNLNLINLTNNIFSKNTLVVDIILLIVIIICVLLSAFFSATETALSSAHKLRLESMVEDKIKGARKAFVLIDDFDKTVIAILIGNNIVNILAATLSAYLFSRIPGITQVLGSILSTLIMTILILTFGEVIPKTSAKSNPEKLLCIFGPIMWLITKFFLPLTYLFYGLKKLFVRKEKTSSSKKATVTNEELEKIVDVMEDEGLIDEEHADLIQRTISIDRNTAYDIMTPRIDVIAIEINQPISEIIEIFDVYKYTRLPVYEGDKDNIIGVLSEKHFLLEVIKAKNNYKNINIRKLITKPYYVNQATKVDDLIFELQANKQHLAIVSDEYGSTSGIVTLEDGLEELVGEIYDEYDEEDGELITKISDNKYQISPNLAINDLYEELDLGNPPDTSYSSIGAYIYNLNETLPKENDIISITQIKEKIEGDEGLKTEYLLKFIIKKVIKRRISALELEIIIVNQEEI